MVEAATTFRKSGFNDQDAATLAKVAAQYQNVADTAVSAEDAASSIVSQIRAFGEDADFATHVIDAYNEVANNFSVGTNDLSQAMEIASAGMATYGNEFEQIIGLVTAGTEIMTGRSSQVARGLNTIASRIVKNQGALEDYGIQVEDVNGNLKSTYDVLAELKPTWDSMSEAERVALGDAIAGTNQYKVLAAVMQNFEHATDATTTALNSSGSAIKENAAYMESLEAKTTAVKATFQDLANNVIDDELVGAVLDLANGFLQLANTDLGRIVTQITLLTGVGWGATGLLQASKIIPAVTSQFKTFASIVTKGLGATATAMSVGGAAVGGLTAALSGALPVILAVAAALAIGGALWKATEDSRKSIDELNDSIDTDNQKLETNKERLAEINGMAWNNKTPEILAEKDALEKENAELEAQIEKYQRLKTEKAQAILDNAYTIETTYSTQRVQGKETFVPTTELIKGAEYYELLTQKLQKYQTILQQNKALTNEQVVEYNNLTSEAGRLASAMENVEGGVASCTNEQQLMYNTLQNTQVAYNEAQTYISNYVNKILKQAEKTGVAKNELYNLAAQMVVTNNQNLNFSQQLAALQQLATRAQVTASAIAGVMGTTEVASKRNLAAWMQTINPATGKNYTQVEAQQKLLSKYWEKLQVKIPETTATPVVVTSGGGGGGTSTSKQTQKNKEEAKDAVKEVKKDAEDAVDNVSDSVSDALNDKKTAMQGVIDYYVEYASRQIEKIEEQLDAINSKYDAMLDAAQKRYDDQLAALEDQYNAVEDQYELQKLMDNLEKAKRTYQMVYRDGQFVYEVDAEKVKEAQEALSAYKRKKEYEERKKQLQESLKNETEYIEKLRKAQTEALEDEKKRWEEYKKGWSELTDEYEFQQNKLLADQMFGAEQENATWQTRLANLQSFVSQYNRLMSQIGGGGGGGSAGGGSASIGEPGASDGGHSTSWGYDHYKELGYKSYEDWYWNEYMKGEAKNWTAVEENFYKQALKNDLGIDTNKKYSLEDTDYAALMEASAKRGDLAGMTYWARERQNKLATTGQTDVESTRDIYEGLKNKYGLGDSSSSSSSKSDKDSGANYKPGGVSKSDQSKIMGIEDEIERNSQAWFDADEEERKRLHERNEQLRKELEKLNPNGYASGTTSARGGLAMVGEQGPELRVLNQGDGIVSADITRNLMKIGANPKWFAQQSGAGNTILNVANVSLPSVQNAQQFVDGLKNLALQKAYGRT